DADTGAVGLQRIDDIGIVLTRERRSWKIIAHALGPVTAGANRRLRLTRSGIASWRRGGCYQIEPRRMRIVADDALLCSGVIGNDDLALLRWPSSHSFM